MRLDGIWMRELEIDGMRVLELRDPNSGQGWDPAMKPRHQYRLAGGWLIQQRRLPRELAGDEWLDDAPEPWWSPRLERPAGVILQWVRERLTHRQLAEYEWQAQHAAGHVVAYTPNGREVRRDSRKRPGYEVQPHNDNYWIHCRTLAEARRAFRGGPR